MTFSENFKNSIHKVLKELIKKKSIRDNIDFTAYQLAKEIGMPRSLITNLTHSEEVKRVTDPRISTLVKIVEYFRADGFNITLEDLLGIQEKSIDIQNESIIDTSNVQNIPLYSFKYKKNKKIGTISLKLNKSHDNAFALLSSNDILPFNVGSVFIIDPDLNPESDNIVALRLNDSSEILIKKYKIIKSKVHLQSLEDKNKDIILMPTTHIQILGVVIQINAKT